MAKEILAKELMARIQELLEQAPTKPTLVYFDIIGFCWPIPCLLHMKNVDYELIQIPIFQWAYCDEHVKQALKACFRNGHVQLYVDSEVKLNQSNLIIAYLGENYDLIGGNTKKKYDVMDALVHAYDAPFHFSGLFQANFKMGVSCEVVTARLEAFLGNSV